MVIWTGRAAKRRFRERTRSSARTICLHSFFGIQILLGLAAWWAVSPRGDAVQPTVPYVTLTVAHVLGGALTLAASVLFTLTCYRLIRSAPPRTGSAAVEHSPERAGASAMNETRADTIPGFERPWAYVALTKPDVTFLVVITTVAGFYLGSRGPLNWPLLLHTLWRNAAGRRRARPR